MARKRFLLTYALLERICQRIRGGAFEHVAAEAEGIPRQIFNDWLQRAETPRPRRIYRDLKEMVMQAHAHSRYMAEVKMRLENPRFWLLHGVGKETRHALGWSRPADASGPNELSEPLDIGRHPEILDLISRIRKILQNHPAALADLREALSAEFNLPGRLLRPPTPKRRKARDKSAPHPCNIGASSAPHPCNIGASSVPHPCNIGASSAPDPCNTGASSAPQPFGTSATDVPAGSAPEATRVDPTNPA